MNYSVRIWECINVKKDNKEESEKEQFIKEKIVLSAVKAGTPIRITRDIPCFLHFFDIISM